MSDNTPLIRIEIQRMKHTLITCLSEHTARMDKDIQAAVDAACAPENITRIIQRTAHDEINKAIDEEIAAFYRYGKGRQAVKDAVAQMLDQRDIL